MKKYCDKKGKLLRVKYYGYASKSGDFIKLDESFNTTEIPLYEAYLVVKINREIGEKR